MEHGIQLTLDGLAPNAIVSNAFTPTLGLRGVYKLRQPFSNTITEAIYTCTGINKLSLLVASGVDVFGLYYTPFGLTENDYDEDLEQDKSLITITSEGGSIAHFPVGYLESYPEMNGEVYQRYILQVGLPPTPRDFNFDLLLTSIQTLVQNHLGIDESIVSVVENSDAMLIDTATHELVSAQRNQKAKVSLPLNEAEMWRLRYEAMVVERDQLLDLY